MSVLFSVQPGVLSALMFIFIEALAVGLIDLAAARWISAHYYRRLESGERISLTDANVFALTRYQIGKRIAFSNLLSTFCKIIVLGAIFYVNLSITSREVTDSQPPLNMSSFELNPSDEMWDRNVSYLVTRSYDDSRSCFEQVGDTITYYRIAFNLSDGVQIDSELVPQEKGKTGIYNVNRSSVICTSPKFVTRSIELAKVIGCSRDKEHGCLDNSSIQKRVGIVRLNITDPYNPSQVLYNHIEFNKEDLDRYVFTEYEPDKYRFTCLTTKKGYDEENLILFSNCLLVYRPGHKTLVEHWTYVRDDEINETVLVSYYPGPVFLGDIPIERSQSDHYLSRPEAEIPGDFQKLSADLVALSSEFDAGTLVYLPTVRTVSEMPLVSVVITVVILSLSVLLAMLTFCLCRDTRPRFNTISGLGSLLHRWHFEKSGGEPAPARIEFDHVSETSYVIANTVPNAETEVGTQPPPPPPPIDMSQF